MRELALGCQEWRGRRLPEALTGGERDAWWECSPAAEGWRREGVRGWEGFGEGLRGTVVGGVRRRRRDGARATRAATLRPQLESRSSAERSLAERERSAASPTRMSRSSPFSRRGRHGAPPADDPTRRTRQPLAHPIRRFGAARSDALRRGSAARRRRRARAGHRRFQDAAPFSRTAPNRRIDKELGPLSEPLAPPAV